MQWELKKWWWETPKMLSKERPWRRYRRTISTQKKWTWRITTQPVINTCIRTRHKNYIRKKKKLLLSPLLRMLSERVILCMYFAEMVYAMYCSLVIAVIHFISTTLLLHGALTVIEITWRNSQRSMSLSMMYSIFRTIVILWLLGWWSKSLLYQPCQSHYFS